MVRFGCLVVFAILSSTIFAQAPGKVPDYLGFYALNIPGFQWQEGSKLEAEYRRLTGTLNLDHTRTPLFVAEGRDPIPLSLDQTSRLLLSINTKKPFDVVGIDAKVTLGDGTVKPFFVLFLAIADEKQVNLIPTLTSARSKSDSSNGGPGGGAPGGPGGPDDGPQGGAQFKQSY